MKITFAEMVQLVLQVCPDAVFSEDSSGEIVVATGYKKTSNDEEDYLEQVGD